MAALRSDTTTSDSHPLTPRETRHALLIAALAWGLFGSAWMAMTSGAHFVTFAREKLYVSTFMFGLLGSLPWLAVLMQLPGSFWVEHTRRRKRLFIVSAFIGRLNWILVAALPWVVPARYPDLRIGLFLGLMMLGSLLGNFSTPAWFSWFADMVPEHIRARYLAKRAALSTVTVMVVSLIVSRVVDHDKSFATFTVIFALASLFGLTDVSLFRLVREPPMPAHEGPARRMRNVLLGPLQDRPFRAYLLYAFTECFTFGIAGSFFMLMAKEFLHLDNTQATIYVSVLPMVFTMLALPLWGGVCDRFGAKPLVAVGMVACIAYPVTYLLATPGHYFWYLLACAVIGGCFGSAVSVGDMAMMYSLTPRESRSAYIACLMTASSLGWAIAPALSGALAEHLKPLSLHALGLTWTNLHVLMLISFVARILHTAFVIPHLPEANPRPARELVRHLVCCPFQRLAGGFTALSNQVPFIRNRE